MQLFDKLNEDNFILFASKHYDNPQCLEVNEFYEDLNRIKYVKKLFNRYEYNRDLQVRLILNHIIVIYNVFGIEAANKIMFYKTHDKHYGILKTFLVYLNYLPEEEYVEIPLEETVIKQLRKI